MIGVQGNNMRNLSFIFAAVLLTTACLHADQDEHAGQTTDPAAHVERSVFIHIPDQFKDLKRAPVLFPHDKHTKELKSEGCGACHPKEEGNFVFSFPKAADTHNRKAFMNSFHDACIKCHSDRKKEDKESGPVACGECHVDKTAYHDAKYLPKMPEHYSAMKDTFHKNCIACHQSSAKSAKHAKALDWKSFYVKEKKRVAIEFPKVSFDYFLHNKHLLALDKQCGNCHYISPAQKVKIASEGRETTAQDWLKEVKEGGSLVDGDDAHARCINCHLRLASEKKKSGPVSCKDCHTGVSRTAEEMKDIPRPNHGEKHDDSFLIKLSTGEGKMADVPFNHKAHGARSRSCQECHHSTLEGCSTCHTEKGDAAGKFITLPEAFHAPDSALSCVGCHAKVQKKPDCAGCHAQRPSGLTDSSCKTCHSGSLASLEQSAKKPDPSTLFPEKLQDHLEAGILAKEYEPAKFNHKEIVKALTDISNKSSLASYFHTDEMSVCKSCHHMGPLEKGKPVASCSTCHTARLEPEHRTPALLGAYHQNCIGCHQSMDRPEDKMPMKCEGCHKEAGAEQGVESKKSH